MVIDLFFALILFLFTIRGVYRGFVREVFSFVALFGGLVVAYRYHYLVEKQIPEAFGSYPSPVLSFLILFVVTFIIFHLFLLLVSLLVSSAGLSFFDRLLGGGMGLLKGLFISMLLVIGIERFAGSSYAIIRESILFNRLSYLFEHLKTLSGGVF